MCLSALAIGLSPTDYFQELAMNEISIHNAIARLRQLAVAAAACGAVTSPAAFAQPVSNLILVPPAELPEVVRQSGDAMLLQKRSDGSTLLYIEQNQGANIAVLDVSDPSRIRSDGAAHLDAPGPFDFVFSMGHDGELVRFRKDQGEAVLDLHKVKSPRLNRVQGLTFHGAIARLGEDGIIVTNQDDLPAQRTRDYQVVDTADVQSLGHVFDVKDVQEELTDSSTGATFLLTEKGLYLIRRPAVEMEKVSRELGSAG
jgi:hypothetical protein